MKLLTINELSLFLKVKKSTLYSWVHNSSVPFYKLNGLLRFDLDEIMEWIKDSKHIPLPYHISIKPNKSLDIDNIIKNAIEGVKGKRYNTTSGKPDRDQSLKKGGLNGTL